MAHIATSTAYILVVTALQTSYLQRYRTTINPTGRNAYVKARTAINLINLFLTKIIDSSTTTSKLANN